MLTLLVSVLLIAATSATISKYCNDGSNPCQLDRPGSPNSYFHALNGYHCLDTFNGHILCTCPDNSTRRDLPCRLCDREPNPCGSGPTKMTCTDLNRSFSCLCTDEHGQMIVSSRSCDEKGVRPVSQPTTCNNGGVSHPSTNECHCPSGFNGSQCETRLDSQLCDHIACMSNGVCAIRPIVRGSKVHQSMCLCRAGFQGDFCEQQGSLGSCSKDHCVNGGICQQGQQSSSRYRFCRCPPSWAGSRCEKQYFKCQATGLFADQYLKKQGKYFSCVQRRDNEYLLQHKSCPKGLQFDLETELCLLPMAATID